MATGCITTPLCPSNMAWPEKKSRFGCLLWPDQWLTHTVHSFMVWKGCNGLTVAWSTFHEWLPEVWPRHVPDKCCVWWEVCTIFTFGFSHTNKPIFRCFLQVWKLFPSNLSSALELLKMECGVTDGLVAAAKDTPFLFRLATGQHKYYSAAWNRYGHHEEKTEESFQTISANFS